MPTTAADSIAGVVIPGIELVREITAFIRDTEDELLFDHSRRVFLFGVLQGRRRGLQPDLELLYAGAMFHDIGLTETYRTPMLRFVDGANAARSTTATNTARTALSETSTLTYSSISTHRSSATISSISSATTAGPSEMHSDSKYLRSPKRKPSAGNKPEPQPPSASSVRICGLLVALHAVAMTHAQRDWNQSN
jgi:hypothetical protein